MSVIELKSGVKLLLLVGKGDAVNTTCGSVIDFLEPAIVTILAAVFLTSSDFKVTVGNMES